MTATLHTDPIDDSPGYETGFHLTACDLTALRQEIRQHLADAIHSRAPSQVALFESTSLEDYHTISERLPHDALVTRTHRILPQTAVDALRRSELAAQLRDRFGDFSISDEEGVGRESVSLRLVRPGMAGDIGSLHADSWFWDLYNFHVPRNTKRVKVWVAICCEPGKSGLRLVPDSHLRTWNYHVIKRAGMKKPVLDPAEKPQLLLFHSSPGDAVSFNYQLLHGGAVTAGAKTRVSIEFTLLLHGTRH
jgi:hypothetical protein